MTVKVSDLYIVTNHFKAGGVHYFAGTVMTYEEVLKVRLYRMRLNEQKIIRMDLPKDKLKTRLEIISAKWNVDALANVQAAVSKGSVSAEPIAKADKPTPGTKAAPAKAEAPAKPKGTIKKG